MIRMMNKWWFFWKHIIIEYRYYIYNDNFFLLAIECTIDYVLLKSYNAVQATQFKNKILIQNKFDQIIGITAVMLM